MTPTPSPPNEPNPIPDERRKYWRRKLGRLRLGAEPIPEQVERYRKATLALTAVPATVGLMFVALFSAFGRPGIGAILALVLMGPIVAMAWVDFLILRSRAAAYLRETTGETRETSAG